MRYTVISAATAAFVLALAFGAAAPAIAGSAENIKFRQNSMKAFGGHAGAIGAIVKGEVQASPATLKAHASALAGVARTIEDAFPADSMTGETKALPAIWEKPDDFAKAVAAFKDATAKLETAAMGGDLTATAAAFGAVGKTCGGCHKEFRGK